MRIFSLGVSRNPVYRVKSFLFVNQKKAKHSMRLLSWLPKAFDWQKKKYRMDLSDETKIG
jgi:hypothetical protein